MRVLLRLLGVVVVVFVGDGLDAGGVAAAGCAVCGEGAEYAPVVASCADGVYWATLYWT